MITQIMKDKNKMNVIRMIIDRDCHVSMSDRQVIKHVISRLKKGYTTFKAMPKRDRHRFMRELIKE